jgi:hypothetical protein
MNIMHRSSGKILQGVVSHHAGEPVRRSPIEGTHQTAAFASHELKRNFPETAMSAPFGSRRTTGLGAKRPGGIDVKQTYLTVASDASVGRKAAIAPANDELREFGPMRKFGCELNLAGPRQLWRSPSLVTQRVPASRRRRSESRGFKLGCRGSSSCGMQSGESPACCS